MVTRSSSHILSVLRILFVTMLLYYEPSGLRRLSGEFQSFIIGDYQLTSNANNIYAIHLLLDLNGFLADHHKQLKIMTCLKLIFNVIKYEILD